MQRAACAGKRHCYLLADGRSCWFCCVTDRKTRQPHDYSWQGRGSALIIVDAYREPPRCRSVFSSAYQCDASPIDDLVFNQTYHGGISRSRGRSIYISRCSTVGVPNSSFAIHQGSFSSRLVRPAHREKDKFCAGTVRAELSAASAGMAGCSRSPASSSPVGFISPAASSMARKEDVQRKMHHNRQMLPHAHTLHGSQIGH